METNQAKIRVLIVEDDVEAATDIASLLQKEDYEVATAPNGVEGLKAFETTRAEIMIIDITLPKMDGMELLQKIKKQAPAVPVIMMTGFGTTEKAISALREHAFDYIKKPLDIDYLIHSVGLAARAALDNRRHATYPTIMLADDDRTARENLAEVLEKEGWHIVQAVDGEDALEKFGAQKIDIAVLDINMPRLNGLGALQKMREITSDFEVIICTGYGDESAAIRAMRDGAMNFIRKPIDIENLIISIEKGLEKLSLTRSLRLRDQEVCLTREMLVKLTQQKEIILNLNDYVLKDMQLFAQELIRGLGLPVLIFDQKLQVICIKPQREGPVTFLRFGDNDAQVQSYLSELGVALPYERLKEPLVAKVNEFFEEKQAGHVFFALDGQAATLIPFRLVGGRLEDRRIVVLLHSSAKGEQA